MHSQNNNSKQHSIRILLLYLFRDISVSIPFRLLFPPEFSLQQQYVKRYLAVCFDHGTTALSILLQQGMRVLRGAIINQ
jgi:hypothetical protein